MPKKSLRKLKALVEARDLERKLKKVYKRLISPQSSIQDRVEYDELRCRLLIVVSNQYYHEAFDY